MPIPNLRSPMQSVARRVRAYFAPVDRNSSTPTAFNFARDGMFQLSSPPGPWIDAGWIDNFSRTASTKAEALRSGPKAAPSSQFRAQLGAIVEFEFRQWGKLQMALACGSEQMNILKPDLDSDQSGNTPLAPVPLLAGSTATQLLVAPVTLSKFNVGDLLAIDIDYVNQIGYLGTGIAAAYVTSGASVHFDSNYIRRVSFNVGRIYSISASALMLAQPLIGGVPAPAAKIQKITGFADREGGPFVQEWSALFVIPDELGGRVLFYYPRLQSSATARELAIDLSGSGGSSNSKPETRNTKLTAWSQPAGFLALPINDPVDSQQIVCQRAYFPAASAAIY